MMIGRMPGLFSSVIGRRLKNRHIPPTLRPTPDSAGKVYQREVRFPLPGIQNQRGMGLDPSLAAVTASRLMKWVAPSGIGHWDEVSTHWIDANP